VNEGVNKLSSLSGYEYKGEFVLSCALLVDINSEGTGDSSNISEELLSEGSEPDILLGESMKDGLLDGDKLG